MDEWQLHIFKMRQNFTLSLFSVRPENIRKPYGFLMFPWGREWERMGQIIMIETFGLSSWQI